MDSRINLTEILRNHWGTIKSRNGKIYRKDKWHFIFLPLLFSIVLSIIVKVPSSGLVNIFAICLSVFIGLFLNLLVLIISFAETKFQVTDKKTRSQLLEYTFYNITYVIVASLVALGVLFFANIDLNEDIFCIKLRDYVFSSNWNQVTKIILYFLFFNLFIHIVMNLLMIIKRIFSLFKVEIQEIGKQGLG